MKKTQTHKTVLKIKCSEHAIKAIIGCLRPIQSLFNVHIRFDGNFCVNDTSPSFHFWIFLTATNSQIRANIPANYSCSEMGSHAFVMNCLLNVNEAQTIDTFFSLAHHLKRSHCLHSMFYANFQ